MKQPSPDSAANAIRTLLLPRIPTTWDQYNDKKHDADAYEATKLVQEQCNGPGKDGPVSFYQAGQAVAGAMPELFAEYWEKLPR